MKTSFVSLKQIYLCEMNVNGTRPELEGKIENEKQCSSGIIAP